MTTAREKRRKRELDKKLQKQALVEVTKVDNDSRVMTFRQWRALNGLSKTTAWRLIKNGKGPVVTQFTAKRVGVTVRANREWLASRTRGA